MTIVGNSTTKTEENVSIFSIHFCRNHLMLSEVG